MREFILQEQKDHIKVINQCMDINGALVVFLTETICTCFRNGKKLLLCGNGGSAADAQHIAAEFINRFRFDRSALPAIALTTDTSILTCIANDSSFDLVFSRQVDALAMKGDILVGISTSGKSSNVLNALAIARTNGVTTIGFTGEEGRETMGAQCDNCFVIPSNDTARIQECILFVWHIICGLVENKMFTQPNTFNPGEENG